jgi:Rod binding domain-containing protein
MQAAATSPAPSPAAAGTAPRSSQELRATFQEFAAGTFYKQMLKALRQGHGKPAYFHGGRGEEVFRQQLDEHVTDALARSHGDALAAPLFEAAAQRW